MAARGSEEAGGPAGSAGCWALLKVSHVACRMMLLQAQLSRSRPHRAVETAAQPGGSSAGL